MNVDAIKGRKKIGRGKRFSIFLLVIALLVSPVIHPKPVQAADFGYSGLGDIVYMWLHSDGNVRAMDRNGGVAEFNYVSWKKIQNSSVSGWVDAGCHVDKTRGVIFLDRNSKIYDINTNTWSNLARTYDFYGDGFFYTYRTVREGNYSHLEVTKYNYSEQLVGTYTFGESGKFSENASVHLWYISTDGKKICFKTSQSGTNQSFLVINQNMTVSHRGSVQSITAKAYRIGNTTYYTYVSYGSGYYRYSSNENLSSPTNIVYVTSDYDSYNNFGISEYEQVIFTSQSGDVYEGNRLIFNAGDYRYATACYDKFGNKIYGGKSGRVMVRSTGGMTSTDTNFYSDLLEAETAELARKAATEATKAFNKVQELYNLVNNEATGLVALNNKISNPTYGLENIYNKIQTVENKVADIQFPPTVEKLIGINNTTATKGNSVLIELVVDNANICRYKVNDGAYGNWVNIEEVDYISVELGSTPGMKNITMQFAQGIRDEGGNYIITSPLKSKGLKIFKL